MTIKNKDDLNRGLEIDLTGPQGNAFCLLGIASNLCEQLNGTKNDFLIKDWEVIKTEMKSGDYENLIKVFDREFGKYVTLYR